MENKTDDVIFLALLGTSIGLALPFVQSLARVTGMSWWAKIPTFIGVTLAVYFLISLIGKLFILIENISERR